ncbi:hypothetical protein HELRODRAFT_64112, partial [Helobdella robusta]|uniref:Cyclic nucleotide-binding domain-containing protein n=1 Tax=Helobdella robusta TaxID=6412 RepID=T1FXP5_HELRO
IKKFIIPHNSPLKGAWDWLILVLVLYVAVLTPYMAAFKPYENGFNFTDSKHNFQPSPIYFRFIGHFFSDPFLIIDSIVDFLFFLDMLCNFRTTYLDNGEVITCPKKIAINYLKRWFIIDFLSAVPFDVIVTLYKKSDTVTATSLMKTARLLRLFRVARKMDHYSEYGASLLLLFMAMITLLAHWLACGFYILAESERLSLKHPIGWLDYLANKTGNYYYANNSNSGPDIHSKYITSLYFTFTILTSVGFGNIAPVTDWEKTFAIGAMIIGSLANAAIFGNVATIMHRMYRGNKEFHDKSASIKDFIKFHRIPKMLSSKLQDITQEDWWQTNGVDMNKVLQSFPEGLQADVCLHTNRILFSKFSAFQSGSPGCLRMLSVRIKSVHFLPGEEIIHQNDLTKAIYFVLRGTIEISKECVVVAILTKNDTFGECSKTLEDKINLSSCLGFRSKYSVRALSYCDIHKIAISDIVDVFRVYPEFASDFCKKFVVTFDINSEVSFTGLFIF